MDFNLELNVVASLFSLLSVLILWLSIYLFRSVVKTAEFVEKKGLGSGFILAALPLMLMQPLVSSYFYLTTGVPAPAEISAFSIGAMLLAALLIFVPIWNLTRLSRSMKPPLVMLAIYVVVYPIANFLYGNALPEPQMLVQAMYLLAEMVLGIGFILLSRYTSDFKSLTVRILDKEFSTHYELSSLLMITGIALPIDAVLRAVAVSDFYTSTGADAALDVQKLRLLSFFLLTMISIGATVGMLVFKKTTEEFCIRLGSMGTLIKKEPRTGPKEYGRK